MHYYSKDGKWKLTHARGDWGIFRNIGKRWYNDGWEYVDELDKTEAKQARVKLHMHPFWK